MSDEHTSRVHDAQTSFRRAIASRPPHGEVRLTKSTSNLFRFARRRDAARFDARSLTHVLEINADEQWARVEGMITYEDLLEATLPHGLMPTVVPQLRTITLGGAVTGLGIEATSLKQGLPHESVEEMQILTGKGDIITASRSENPELFFAFPNSYGTLGYLLSARIRLAPVSPWVSVQHRRFTDLEAVADAIGEYAQAPPEFLDGVMFSEKETYLSVATSTREVPSQLSDYTREKVYYRSLQQRERDTLSTRDYIWRWDTDWFWCSAALGVQNPWIRRLWPKKLMRSDVYHSLVSWDQRLGITKRLDRWRGKPAREAVIQDVEVPLTQLAAFLAEFHQHIGVRPVWLCPLTTRETWPLYPIPAGEVFVNVGFWAHVPQHESAEPEHYNRLVEKLVAEHNGHKSLYSSVHYTEDEFWLHYNKDEYWRVKREHDPEGNLPDLYTKIIDP